VGNRRVFGLVLSEAMEKRVHSVNKKLDVYNIARVVNVECMRVAREMRKG
jgi:hypothetical protein